MPKEQNQFTEIGQLEAFEELVRSSIESLSDQNETLPLVHGELRISIETLKGVLSNQIHQKQANWRVQSLLERWAEPFSAIRWFLLFKTKNLTLKIIKE